jgi:hypothetical protein
LNKKKEDVSKVKTLEIILLFSNKSYQEYEQKGCQKPVFFNWLLAAFLGRLF